MESSSFESRQLVNDFLFTLESQIPGYKVNNSSLSVMFGMKAPSSGNSQAEGMRVAGPAWRAGE